MRASLWIILIIASANIIIYPICVISVLIEHFKANFIAALVFTGIFQFSLSVLYMNFLYYLKDN